MDVNNFLNGMNKDSIRQLSNLINTPQGQELMKKLKGVNKSEVMKFLNNMDDSDVPREDLIKQITKNPDLIKKLNDFLDRK